MALKDKFRKGAIEGFRGYFEPLVNVIEKVSSRQEAVPITTGRAVHLKQYVGARRRLGQQHVVIVNNRPYGVKVEAGVDGNFHLKLQGSSNIDAPGMEAKALISGVPKSSGIFGRRSRAKYAKR